MPRKKRSQATTDRHAVERSKPGVPDRVLYSSDPPKHNRVILLMDVDCFEVQVRVKQRGIDQEDLPTIVVDHSGLILSINYKARAMGIKKEKKRVNVMEMEKDHPRLWIIQAELKRGLSDTLLLRKESDKILDAIRFHPLVKGEKLVLERNNNDEIYIDCTDIVSKILESPSSAPSFKNDYLLLTRTSTAVDEPQIVFEDYAKISSNMRINTIMDMYRRDGWADHKANSRLMYGAKIAREFHQSIWKNTGYRVSFGVAQNKMLAKIGCEENKPNAITVLTDKGRARLFQTLDFQKLPGYRSDTGDKLRRAAEKFRLDLVTLEDVRGYKDDVFEKLFYSMRSENPRAATFFLRLKADGICNEAVNSKLHNNGIQKSVPLSGDNAIHTWPELRKRIVDLAVVFYEELEYHARRYNEYPRVIAVSTEPKPGWKGRKVATNVRSTLKDLQCLPAQPAVQGLIEEYVYNKHIGFYEYILRIRVTASKFVPLPNEGCQNTSITMSCMS